jgi:hypothetical protein
MKEKCYGCSGFFESQANDMPLHHPYIGSSHACWQVYGEILAREFGDSEYFKIHRLTVDSYSAQHIGDQTDRRARQSANLHLIALYLTVDQNSAIEEVIDFLRKATTDKMDWPPIIQRTKPEWLTVNDILPAKSALEHTTLVKVWSQSVWEAYADCHSDIIATYEHWRYR